MEGKIIEQCKAKQNREEVEETIVAGQKNEQLQANQCATCKPAQTARCKDEEWNDELNEEQQPGGGFLECQRKLVCEPANPGWQRLVFKMKRERGEIPPGWVAAEQFNGAGLEHEPEQKQPQQPENDARGLNCPRPPRKQLQGGEEDCQETGFQQQDVPLKTEELAAYGGE